MRILKKLAIALLLLMIIVPLWLIGYRSITSAIGEGHFPMYEMATYLNCPEWLPLGLAIGMFGLFYYIIVWRGMIKPYLQN